MEQILLMMSQGKQGGMEPLFMLAIVAIMFFFMLRPQLKKQKEQKAFNTTIEVGDKIVTIGGIHGKITKKNGDGTITIECERNSSVIVEAGSVSMEMTVAMRKRNDAAIAKA